MRTTRQTLGFLVLLTLGWASVAHAGHHLWTITEVFSNSDGTIQFVELIGNSDNEQAIVSFTIDTSPVGTTGSIMTTASLAGPVLGPATTGQYFLVGLRHGSPRTVGACSGCHAA